MLATTTPDEQKERIHRDYCPPADLRLSFDLSGSTGLHTSLVVYNSCKDWLPALRKATAKAYQTHHRLFCKSWHIDPCILLILIDEQIKEIYWTSTCHT